MERACIGQAVKLVAGISTNEALCQFPGKKPYPRQSAEEGIPSRIDFGLRGYRVPCAHRTLCSAHPLCYPNHPSLLARPGMDLMTFSAAWAETKQSPIRPWGIDLQRYVLGHPPFEEAVRIDTTHLDRPEIFPWQEYFCEPCGPTKDGQGHVVEDGLVLYPLQEAVRGRFKTDGELKSASYCAADETS